MHDLNFFINLNAEKDRLPVARILLITLIVIVLAFIGLFIYLFNLTTQVQTEIAALEQQFADPKVIEARAQLDLIKQRQALLDQYDLSLTYIDGALSRQDQIKKEKLDTIAAAIPQNVVVSSISLSPTNVMIEARTENETAKAELVRNLKDTGLFESAELLNATLEEEMTDGTTGEVTPAQWVISLQAMFKEVVPQ